MNTATLNLHKPLSTTSLTGNTVKYNNDEDLGNVHDIMVDFESGRISYVVMSSGGFPGLGNKLFAIPVSALKADRDQEILLLDASRETFENAEGFDKGNWPDMANPEWEQRTHERFGVSPNYAS